MKFMFHSSKFKRLQSRECFQAQTILLEPIAKTPSSPGKTNDNLPEENTFPPLATLASWRLIRANRFNYYAG
jgi:hypothetical protein